MNLEIKTREEAILFAIATLGDIFRNSTDIVSRGKAWEALNTLVKSTSFNKD